MKTPVSLLPPSIYCHIIHTDVLLAWGCSASKRGRILRTGQERPRGTRAGLNGRPGSRPKGAPTVQASFTIVEGSLILYISLVEQRLL